MVTRLLLVALGVVVATAAPSAQSDLDEFMGRVLARRDANWKKLQQYVLEERETFRVDGLTGSRLYGFITAMSSGLLYRSTSMTWKSMPFSYSTKRQGWLKGQVVPE